MADTNIENATVSNMNSNVPDFSVSKKTLDTVNSEGETYWYFKDWSKYLGYYKQIPEIKTSIDALARWTCAKGFETDNRTEAILENITGYGEDTFLTILKNMIITSLINGDSFAEIIRDEQGNLINLKPLDPSKIKLVIDNQGRLKRYEQIAGSKTIEFEVYEIFHLCHGRVCDEIHGTSVIESVENILLMRNESLTDYQKVLHRNVYPFKIWKLDTDNQNKINSFIAKVEKTVKDKENIFIPKGNVELEIPSISSNSTLNPLPWINYLSNFFFQAVGIPQIILGGSQEFTDATAKIAYLSFETTISDIQEHIEAQIWAQLNLKIDLNPVPSIQNDMISDRNKEQSAIQPSDTIAGQGE